MISIPRKIGGERQIAQQLMTLAERLAQDWKSRLEQDCPEESSSTRESVVRWLLGDRPERFDTLANRCLRFAKVEFVLEKRHPWVRGWAANKNVVLMIQVPHLQVFSGAHKNLLL